MGFTWGPKIGVWIVISMHTQILPRLEVFFLEEWIEHNSMLGVDKFYVYDNGLKSVEPQMRARSAGESLRVLDKQEQGVKWVKKPNSDYFEDYSNSDIYEKLQEVVTKFKDRVTLVPWYTGESCQHTSRIKCQIAGYQHCVDDNDSDWWIHMDPDEYILPLHHKNIIEFLDEYHGEKGYTSFELKQRVFDTRRRDAPVRSITNWGYETQLRKCISKSPTRMSARNVHRIRSSSGPFLIVDRDIMRFNHYRGHPSQVPDKHHIKFKSNKFDKVDDTMLRFIEK
jgi:hypothetical protein